MNFSDRKKDPLIILSFLWLLTEDFVIFFVQSLTLFVNVLQKILHLSAGKSLFKDIPTSL